MPSVTTTNANDSFVEIIPLDSQHHSSIPDSLAPLLPELPPGSFLLKNKIAVPVNVIVVTWLYTDKSGTPKQLNIYCDAYLLTRVDPLVQPNDSALVTPDSCTRQEYFGRLKAQSFLGSPLQSERNTALQTGKDTISAIQISIDCVIFADGQIWGPDNRQYYKKIMQRGAVRQSVADEVSTARADGEDMSSRLAKIQAEGLAKKDKFSSQRVYYANLIQSSPNPEGTLRSLQQQVLPDFRHIGEQK